MAKSKPPAAWGPPGAAGRRGQRLQSTPRRAVLGHLGWVG